MNMKLNCVFRMANQEVKLLGTWSSPFVSRVIWALKLKGVEYELLLEANIRNKSSLLVEANPVHKLVPVLFHGGKTISESLVILEYIDETWPQNPILPQDPHKRAKARFWAKFADEKLMDVVRKFIRTEGETQVNQVKQFGEALDMIEKEAECKQSKFFAGESIGYLDFVLGWTILWLEIIDEVSCESKIVDRQRYPYFSQWRDDFGDLTVIKENLPDKVDLFGYLKTLRISLVSTVKN